MEDVVSDFPSSTALHQTLRDILLIWCCFAVAGCIVNQPGNGLVSKAQISLEQARRSRADVKTAIGYYLNAADSALKSANSSSSNCQTIYNSACRELAILLKANPRFWNRNEPVSVGGQTYRLQFTHGSHQAGIWDPVYFDYLRIPLRSRQRVR